MRSSQLCHKLLLAGILLLVALVSNLPDKKEQARTQALDAFLASLPGEVVIHGTTNRTNVLFNASDHPSLTIEYARESGLPEELITQIFELQDQAPVPSSLKHGRVLPNENKFRPELRGNKTFVVVSPIALNKELDEALFGSVYALGEKEIVVALVWMMKSDKDQWSAKKIAR